MMYRLDLDDARLVLPVAIHLDDDGAPVGKRGADAPRHARRHVRHALELSHLAPPGVTSFDLCIIRLPFGIARNPRKHDEARQ